jgi:cyclophilin family peptidyl-prolyl cis-trans isomerase
MRIHFLKIAVCLAILIATSCKTTKYTDLSDGLYADIETTKGDILLKLYYETVPRTTANFISLAEGTNTYVSEKFKGKPFYDGLTFHRVVANFMIQGGDPNGNGTGGPGYKFENEHPKKLDSTDMYVFDKAGVLAMANAGRDSNGSQFFITHNEYSSIDGGYTIFGQLEKGQNVVDSIAIGDKINAVNIIRVGKEAKLFNATKIFDDYFAKLEAVAKLKQEVMAKAKADFLKRVDESKENANELPSGLKMLITEKGSGIKPQTGTSVRINCSGYFTDGNLFYSTHKEVNEIFGKYDQRAEDIGAYNPFTMPYSMEATLVPGFKEGMLNMEFGDKALLFIPSHLGYGPERKGPIPPNTDLIFEIELVDESQDQE